jgi:hypothetical protein
LFSIEKRGFALIRTSFPAAGGATRIWPKVRSIFFIFFSTHSILSTCHVLDISLDASATHPLQCISIATMKCFQSHRRICIVLPSHKTSFQCIFLPSFNSGSSVLFLFQSISEHRARLIVHVGGCYRRHDLLCLLRHNEMAGP